LLKMVKWIETTLGEEFEIVMGQSPSSEFYNTNGEGLPFFQGKKEFSEKYPTIEKWTTEATKKADKGDILLSVRAPIGAVNISPAKCGIGRGLAAIKPNNKTRNSFIFYLLQSLESELKKRGAGVTFTAITKPNLLGVPIQIPVEKNDRNKIVDEIETQFTRLDSAIQSLKTIKNKLELYRKSVLKAAFEGELTEEWRKDNKITSSALELLKVCYKKRREAWEAEQLQKMKLKGKLPRNDNWKKKYKEPTNITSSRTLKIPNNWAFGLLEDLIYIAGRIGWRGLKAEEYTEEGPLFLSVYNLNSGIKVNFENSYHISEERYEESPEIKLKENDILLTKDGAGIGKIGIVKKLKEEATVNSSLLVIRSGDVFIPEFLLYFLMGPKMRRVVRERITGSATPHLFQRDIKKFEILIPPPEEQIAIVNEIESRFSVIDKVEEIVDNALIKAERLRKSILKSAFEGKLVK